MSKQSIDRRRGCEWDDFGNAITLVVVRAPCKDVADALATRYKGKVEVVDPYDVSEKHPDIAQVVFQHSGHSFCIFASTDTNPDIAGDLSKQLKTRALTLMHEDTAGWTECRVFDSGENVETYTFGPDYASEMETLAEEMGEEFGEGGPQIMQTDGDKPWDHSMKDDHENDYRFRSDLRKVKADAVIDSDAMINDIFAAADVWLPGWAHFPFSDPKEYPNEEKSNFTSAFRVKVR